MDAGRHFRQCQNLRDIRYVFHTKHYLLWWCSSWLFQHVDDYKWATFKTRWARDSMCYDWRWHIHSLFCLSDKNLVIFHHFDRLFLIALLNYTLQNLEQNCKCWSNQLYVKYATLPRDDARRNRNVKSSHVAGFWYYMRHMHDFCADIDFTVTSYDMN